VHVAVAHPDIGAVGIVLILLWLASAVLGIVAWVRIVQKAGYSGWLVLTAIIPIVNIVIFLIFAFAEWPVTRELNQLRAMAGRQQPGYGYPPPYPPPPYSPPPQSY
jgi:hypothetical protein